MTQAHGPSLARRLLPATPDTTDLGALFPLLFEDADGVWLAEVDDDTLARVVALLRPASCTPVAGLRATPSLCKSIEAMPQSAKLRTSPASGTIAPAAIRAPSSLP